MIRSFTSLVTAICISFIGVYAVTGAETMRVVALPIANGATDVSPSNVAVMSDIK